MNPAILSAVLLVALASCGGDAPGFAEDRGGSDGWAGSVLQAPLARPDFMLTDMNGEPYDFRAETEGKVTLLFFGYTHCPDVCPVHMANVAAVLRDLPSELTRHVEVVFVTTDPDRDTPERLREWLGLMDWRIVGLRGTREEVNAIEASLEIPQSTVQTQVDGSVFVAHASQVIAFGADGPARVVYPWGIRQHDWQRDLPRLIRETVEGAGG